MLFEPVFILGFRIRDLLKAIVAQRREGSINEYDGAEALVAGKGAECLGKLIGIKPALGVCDHGMDPIVRALVHDAFELLLQTGCISDQSKVVAQLQRSLGSDDCLHLAFVQKIRKFHVHRRDVIVRAEERTVKIGAWRLVENLLPDKTVRDLCGLPVVQVRAHEGVFDILCAGCERFHLRACLLIDGLHQQNRFQDARLIADQITGAAIAVQHLADVPVQELLALFIEEVPQQVYRQKRVVVRRAKCIDKPLKPTNLIASVVLQKIEHTPHIACIIAGHVFKQQRGIRMQRQNVTQLRVLNFGLLLHQGTGVPGALIELLGGFRPFIHQMGVLALLQGFTHQTEGHVIGQLNVAEGQRKAVADDVPVFILGREQVGHVMGDGNQIEEVALRHFHQRLQAGQAGSVILEEIRKLIPDEDEAVQVIVLDDRTDPVLQHFLGQGQHADAAFIGYFHDLGHDF